MVAASPFRIFIVEDDPLYSKLLNSCLKLDSDHEVNVFAENNPMHRFKLSAPAADKLKRYPFPGNIRKLKAVMELAAMGDSATSIT